MVLAALIRAVVVLAIALLGSVSISPLATSVTYGYDGRDSTATSAADDEGDAAVDLLVRGRSLTLRDFNHRYDEPANLARALARFDGDRMAPSRAAGAESAAQGARLRTHLRLTQDYEAGGVRELAVGRIRYYDVLDPARKPGTMAGRRLVREWDPASGGMRTWHETLDHQGRIRQVRPVENTRHYTFDESGNYTGYWPG